MSVSSNTVNLDIAALNATGTFSKSEPITISASTSNITGYTLSIAATNATNSDKLIHETDSTATLNSITDATTESAYSAMNSTALNGTFGYLPSKYASTTNTDFRPAPSITGDVIEKTTSSNTTANNYSLALGARVDSTTKIGAYSNTYIVRLVANTIPYSITYNDTIVTNMPVDVVGNASSSTVAISSTTPTRAGYIFKGWCSSLPTGDGSICPTGATTYQPGSSYTLTGASNDLNLYAMWGGTFDQAYNLAGKTKVTVGSNSYYALQDMTPDICNAVSQDSVTEVVDTRDNQIYHIGKLADNKCWTLDNLALDLINVDIANLKGKTNASDISLEYLKGTRTGTTTDQYPTAGVATFTSANNYSIPNMIASGTCYDTNCANSPASGQWDKDSVVGAIAGSAGNNKIGIYYNYCAASAGTYCWGNGTNYAGSPSTDPNSGTLMDVKEDICPLNWHMPTSDTGSTPYGEYRTLYLAYSSNYTNFRKALSTPLSGYYSSGSARNQGTRGYFWSSTWYVTNNVRNLYMSASNIDPSGTSSRNSGFSVRCIAS